MKLDSKKSEELLDWVDALENLILFNGKKEAGEVIEELFSYASSKGILGNKSYQLPFEK